MGQHCCKAHTLSTESSPYAANWTTTVTRRALSGAHIPPTKVFRRLSEYNNFKTTCRCSGGLRQYAYVGFSRRKIPRPSAYTISEKAIRFRHPGHNPDRAQKLTSSSMSRHLSTGNISSKSIHAFLSSLANRQTDRQTREKHLSPPLSEVIIHACTEIYTGLSIIRLRALASFIGLRT